MRRLALSHLGIPPREHAAWTKSCEDAGFDYHSIDGAYWVDDQFYALQPQQWEALQRACAEWEGMFVQATDAFFADGPEVGVAIGIPLAWYERVRASWVQREPNLGWRWDTLWDGTHWRLLECNASAWSGLLESVVPQEDWARDVGLYQPNTLVQDGVSWFGEHLQGTCAVSYALSNHRVSMATAEEVLRWANLSGKPEMHRVVPLELLWRSKHMDIENLGFKVAPWEWWMNYNGAEPVPLGHARWAMPLWSTVWHSKGFLAWVWQLNKGHPTLIEASLSPIDGVASHQHVRKPFWGGEGAGVERTAQLASDGGVYQKFVDAPVGGKYPTIGAWCINGRLSGLYMRECDNWKLDEWSRMLPYAVV